METSRKVIGIGESILDILFRHGQPEAAVHGGSSFNSIVSVGRAGVPCTFVGYTGADNVGRQTADFLRNNGIGTDFFQLRHGLKSAVSLAFLAENGDADYSFYKEEPDAGSSWSLPDVSRGDIILFGSYYAASHGMRPLIADALEKAALSGGIAFYDVNFRPSHQDELQGLMPNILANFSRSTIVRGSTEDFEVMFRARDARNIYIRYIRPYCPYFILTAGADDITVCTPEATYRFEVPEVHGVVSTVGAGDSFNAGIACALIWQGIMPEDIPNLSQEAWQRLVGTACLFASETCRSKENYINNEKDTLHLNSLGTRFQLPRR